MDENFLLKTDAAKALFHNYAKEMPIFDYHCHLPVVDIVEDRSFGNLTELWLEGDHYKWRLLRANGVSEDYITGNKSDKEKFIKWAETVPYIIGNPLYHWTHLELKRYFGINEQLNLGTANKIWDISNEMISSPNFSARALIEKSNVKVLCTTDDPLDNLDAHKVINSSPDVSFKVYPTFRPDTAINIGNGSFDTWVQTLGSITKINIQKYPDFLTALEERVKYFNEVGCRLSDHSLEGQFYHEASERQIEKIFQKGISGQELSQMEIVQFKTAVLIELGKMYAKKNWTMQLHVGALRNINTRYFRLIGPNTGFDSMNDIPYIEDLARLLDNLDVNHALPKTVIYGLNPKDYYAIATLIGNFQEGIPGKIQFGTAWWFNDHIDGMTQQLKTLANVGLLSRFIGMVTDSRSFISYPRHEYFRRILCNLIGCWVENGELPEDYDHLGKIVQDICYNNIKNYLSY
jgi:glucuronate isomerase